VINYVAEIVDSQLMSPSLLKGVGVEVEETHLDRRNFDCAEGDAVLDDDSGTTT